MKSSFGIYIHWPFCLSKCPYCDFNSHVREKIDINQWQQGLLQDLKSCLSETSSKQVTSIFFGGGTPSLMPPSLAGSLIDFIYAHWPVSDQVEITLEANPNSTEVSKLKDFSAAGINRISLGIQSLNDETLKFLKRGHTATEALQAIEKARQVFPRYSFDLIYAHPNQTLETWQKELTHALTLASGHLSLYQLTIEEGTPFYLAYHRGDFTMPDEEKSADFYEFTRDAMQDKGYEAYEISNYAQPGQECAHNITYWRYNDYIGVGPGAHGRLTDSTNNKWAIRRHRSPEKWLETCGEHERILLSKQEIFEEILMMGLRLKDGLQIKTLMIYCPEQGEKLLKSSKLEQLQKGNLLHATKDRLILTPAGQLRLNSVLKYIVT
ncbi:MAG: radical SAM family heme chaperone HemW [Alphaproteobacteria bacterium]